MRIIKIASIISIYSILLYSDNFKEIKYKYIDKNSESYKAYKDGKNINYDKGINKDFNLYKELDKYKYSKEDINKLKDKYKEFYIDIKANKKANDEANNINNKVRDKEFNNEIEKYKLYFLKDKDINVKEKVGKYAKYIPIYNKDKKNTKIKLPYHNQFLAKDERLIIAISSSIPKETIINYFKTLERVSSDVVFVLNGFIGNNPKYIKPTLNYIQDLLVYDKANKKTYKYRVDINPKIFMKYDIKEVPAIIFIKNYNILAELQGASYKEYENKKNSIIEDVYIAYSDSNIIYILKKINKKAKSKGLKNLIKNIEKGFFK